MLREMLQVSCSERCELLLALTNIVARERLLECAHVLVTDPSRSAVQLAERLLALPDREARELSLATLSSAGIAIPSGERSGKK